MQLKETGFFDVDVWTDNSGPENMSAHDVYIKLCILAANKVYRYLYCHLFLVKAKNHSECAGP